MLPSVVVISIKLWGAFKNDRVDKRIIILAWKFARQ